MPKPTPCKYTEAALREPENGYLTWRQLDDGTYVAVGRLMFTVALFIGVGPVTPYKRRYCYPSLVDALGACADLQTGQDEPAPGWIAKRPEDRNEKTPTV